MRMDNCKLDFIKGQIKFDEPMRRHTTFKIGGPADVWIAPQDIEDLLNILRYAKVNRIDTFILGGGSKILVGDKGIRGFVIVLNSPNFRSIRFDGDIVDLGCGVNLSEFLSQSAQRNLGGCEFLAGLPGTIGGALIMNAGSPSNGLGDFVEEIVAIKGSRLLHLKNNKISFSYRDSGLAEYILLSAKLKLKKKDKRKIVTELKDNLSRKKRVQDLSYPSVGCIFKNPLKDTSSGKLIELSGFKGHSMGGAVVSTKHANFILNRRHAKASDVLRLIDEIQKKVFKDHGIMLKLEVVFVGEF